MVAGILRAMAKNVVNEVGFRFSASCVGPRLGDTITRWCPTELPGLHSRFFEAPDMPLYCTYTVCTLQDV